MGKHKIKQILEHYGATVRSGRGWVKCKCPFHDDRTASASVNEELNIFICFACQIKGDTYKIIMEREGKNYGEAITFAEGITGEKRSALSKEPSLGRRVPKEQGIISRRRS
ncbi:DNA primase [Freshwater phage uvFW-CGR-AMD-COM-C455]|nr:DNA primase [Freshwater phage uvFW-CGR-AMD-COM-C455]